MPEDEFQRLYGAWDPLSVIELREVLAGFPRPWWIGGGWAIEAFTGVRRQHDDVDVVMFARDVAELRAFLGAAWHVWNADSGWLRPLGEDYPEPRHPESQLWFRHDWSSPWRFEALLTLDRDGRWVNKRDHDHVAPIDDVTWVAPDGIRYERPEISLLFKAKHRRSKDEADAAAALPLLEAERRAWLRDALARTYPGHPWIATIDGM